MSKDPLSEVVVKVSFQLLVDVTVCLVRLDAKISECVVLLSELSHNRNTAKAKTFTSCSSS